MGHVMQLVHAKISCYTPPLYAFLRASTPLPRCPRWTLKEIPRFIQGVQTLDRIERALNRCSQYRAINKIFEIRIDQNPVFKDAQRDFLPKCNEFSTQNWNICTSICNQEYRGQDRVFKDTLKETEVFFLDIEGIIFFLFSRFSKFFSPPCIQACMGWTRERSCRRTLSCEEGELFGRKSQVLGRVGARSRLRFLCKPPLSPPTLIMLDHGNTIWTLYLEF